MRSRAITVVIAGAIACGGSQRSNLSKAGDDRDDGAGLLAQASLKLQTPDEQEEPTGFTDRRAVPSYDYAYGGSMYGGDPYGGFAYGGAGYAGWQVPQWNYTPPNRIPDFNAVSGLRGAIEGTVTWTGQPPGKVTSACGPIDNPTLRVGTDKAARGVIVYIDKISVGRAVPYYARPISVGGILAKRGCALVPAAQIVSPLPNSLAIHGDEGRTKLRVTHEKTTASHELQEAGLIQVEVKPGITRVDAEDSKTSPAWILGLETPYWAITDDAGRYRIDELAAGTYELTFWQPPIAVAGPDGTFTYGQPVITRRNVKVGGKTTQLSISLSGR